MNAGFATPIVLVIFNRAELAHSSVERLRHLRPRHLLVVADGPRGGHPTDAALCADARRAIDSIDWPCRVDLDLAPSNLGCAERIRTGLDWAFGLVDRAIVLEDDIDPHPTFYRWAATMLDRFADDDDISMVSGRNELGRWGAGDHLIVRRGSVYGWGTWADAWFTTRRLGADTTPGPDRDARLDDLDPLLAENLAVRLTLRDIGKPTMWDTEWNTDRLLTGSYAAISPVNLCSNHGFGNDATHTDDPDDIRGLLPRGVAPDPACSHRCEPDPDYDRQSLLVELLATYRRPDVVEKLAAMPSVGPALGVNVDVTRHQYAPFRFPSDALAAVRHLRRVGVRSDRVDQLEAALVAAAERSARR